MQTHTVNIFPYFFSDMGYSQDLLTILTLGTFS